MPAEPTTTTSRLARTRRSRRAPMAVAAVIVVVVVIAAAGWVWVRATGGQGGPAESPTAGLAPVAETTTVALPARVEMPDLVGLDLEHARMVLAAAGMRPKVSSDAVKGASAADEVVSQDPVAGVLTEQGAVATLFVQSVPRAKVARAKSSKSRSKRRFVVCIDPGHQGRSDLTPEPIGPGSKTVKPSVSGGATGVKTLVPEYEIALQISMNLKQRLESQGVKVVMTRTTNDVRLSNAERADIANKTDADLFIRIHADGSPDAKAAGISTLYPTQNKWTKPIAEKSKRAARMMQHAVVISTNAVDRGTIARADQSGFNWAKVPVVLTECGFLSNPIEDRLLASPHYQDKIAEGLCNGTMAFLGVAQ